MGQNLFKKLLNKSLKMEPNRLFSSELRGEVADELLQAVTAGHDRQFTTLQGNEELLREQLLQPMEKGHDGLTTKIL